MTVLKRILTFKYLLLLDVLLIAACVWMGVRLRGQWMATATLDQVANIQPASVSLKKAVEKQKTPAGFQTNYLVISSRNLFSPDRNDQIPKEEAPKPRPPKPVLYGVMNLTETKLALMSTPDTQVFKSLKVGEKIGEYILTKILVNKVELKYENETVEASTEEQPRPIAPPLYGGGIPSPGADSRVVSVSGGGSAAVGSSNSSSPAVPSPATTQAACKGRWVKTLFGETCLEDQK